MKNNDLNLETYLDKTRKTEQESIKLSPTAAVSQYSVEGITKKFLNEGNSSKQ